MDCVHLLTSSSSKLVNVADGRGLTALHWANAEQHVGLMKLLLAKGAVWSDADLLSMVRPHRTSATLAALAPGWLIVIVFLCSIFYYSYSSSASSFSSYTFFFYSNSQIACVCTMCVSGQCDDVTLGHERRPIKIDLTSHLEGGPKGAVGQELLSRLRRFVYIKDCVSETDDFNGAGNHTQGGSSRSSSSSSNGSSSNSNSGNGGSELVLKRGGCDCVDCFANHARCPCVRLNGQRLPYTAMRREGSVGPGPIVGVLLEATLGMTRTKVCKRAHGARARRVIESTRGGVCGLHVSVPEG